VRGFGVLLGGLGDEGDRVGDPDAVVFEGVGAVVSAVVASSVVVARAAFAVARLVLSMPAVVVSVVRHLWVSGCEKRGMVQRLSIWKGSRYVSRKVAVLYSRLRSIYFHLRRHAQSLMSLQIYMRG